MSADVDLVRRAWERWNAGMRTLDLELLDPEIEVHSALTGSVFRGEQGVQQWAAEIDEQFEQWQVTVAAADELREGLLLVRGEIRAKGRGSGMDLDQPAAWLVELRDHRIARIRNFIGHDAAARAGAEGAEASA